ncbi:hypothetical protein RI065_10960 [Mycoplasmatota bacterium zrk1]
MIFVKRVIINLAMLVACSLLITLVFTGQICRSSEIIKWIGLLAMAFPFANYIAPRASNVYYPSHIKYSIRSPYEKIGFKPLIVAGLLMVIIHPVVGNRECTEPARITEDNHIYDLSPLKITTFSSTRYLVSRESGGYIDHDMFFGVNALVRKEIEVNSSLEDKKVTYLPVDDIVEMKTHSFWFADVVEVTLDDDIKVYFQVYFQRNSNEVIELKYDFTNIVEEMNQLGDILRLLPKSMVNDDNIDLRELLEGGYSYLEKKNIVFKNEKIRQLYEQYIRNAEIKMQQDEFAYTIIKEILLSYSDGKYDILEINDIRKSLMSSSP